MRRSPIPVTRSPLRTLLEGEHPWGGFEQSRGTNGVSRYRLVVYPPGLGLDERVALRLWRTFSVWGLGLWILIEVSLMTVVSPWTAVAAATGACLVVGAALMIRAGAARGHVRTMSAVLTPGEDDADARLRTVQALAMRLDDADVRLAHGEMSAVDHEAEVWRVYEQLH